MNTSTHYAVQLRRPPDMPRILLRIASKRGNGKPYVVEDLLRDCLIAYTRDHATLQVMSVFDSGKVATVYVRGNKRGRKYYQDLADSQGITLGKLLESAILYHCGDDIAAIRAKDSKHERVKTRGS